MPCCRRAFQLGAFNVSGIQTVIAKYNESGGCPACRCLLLLAAAAGAGAERPLALLLLLLLLVLPLLVPLAVPSLTGVANPCAPCVCPLRRQGEHSHQRGPERNVPCRPGRCHCGSDGSGCGAPSSSSFPRRKHHRRQRHRRGRRREQHSRCLRRGRRPRGRCRRGQCHRCRGSSGYCHRSCW